MAGCLLLPFDSPTQRLAPMQGLYWVEIACFALVFAKPVEVYGTDPDGLVIPVSHLPP